jgi:hypothetical protein
MSMRNTFSHHQTTEPEVMQPTEHYTNADVYRYSFFPRTIITWNTIPQIIRHVNTIDQFHLTNLVEHQIHLKPDAVFKHQRPYKLPPHKRDVLRHQLLLLPVRRILYIECWLSALQSNINKMSMSIFFNKNRKFCIKN